MTASEFNAARSILGKTDEEVATQLAVEPGIVRAWSTGRTPITRREALLIAWQVEGAKRGAAMKASGLPECEWLEGQAFPDTMNADDLRQFTEAVKSHRAGCPACVDRERYEKEKFGPMPPFPRTGLMLAIGWWFERIPAWAQPAATGASLLGAIVSLRILAAIPFLLSAPARFGQALVAVVAAAGAGAAGGFAYSLTRPTLKRLGRPGDYLTGIVCVLAYMGSLAVVAPIAFGETLIHGRAEAVIFAIVSVFFGLVVGHSWFGRGSQG